MEKSTGAVDALHACGDEPADSERVVGMFREAAAGAADFVVFSPDVLVTDPETLLSTLPRFEEKDGLERFLRLNGATDFSTTITLNGGTIDVCAVFKGGITQTYVGRRRSDNRVVGARVLHIESIGDNSRHERVFREKCFFEDRDHDEVHYWPAVLDEGKITHPGHLRMNVAAPEVDCTLVEIFPGVRLDVLMRRQPHITSRPDFVLLVAMQIAHAMEFYEETGRVVRDLKPENILLTPPVSGRPCVKQFDGNLVHVPGSVLTSPGIVAGTPEYMSPEGAGGKESLDIRHDLYSLGVVMYKMLAHVLPLLGSDAMETMAKHLHDRPPPIGDVPPILQKIIVDLLLAKKREDRIQNAHTARKVFKTCFDTLCGDSGLTQHIGPAYTSP